MLKEKPKGRRVKRRGVKPDAVFHIHIKRNDYPNPLKGEVDTLPMEQNLIVLLYPVNNVNLDNHMRSRKDGFNPAVVKDSP